MAGVSTPQICGARPAELAGRRRIGHFPIRFNPSRRAPEWPFEYVLATPARWPAKNWRLRRTLAKPLRWLEQGIRKAAAALTRPLDQVASLIEGQPLVWFCQAMGWRQTRDADGNRVWVYSGPVTPELVEMFRAHPQRFAQCRPELLAELRARCGEGDAR